MTKPFSQACENNKRPILRVLANAFAQQTQVLEIGSGTGQHAVYFAKKLTHLIWHTSDQPHNHSGINQWIADAKLANLKPPVALTIGQQALPDIGFDGVFTANTAHIMQREDVVTLMQNVASRLPTGGTFCQYGPFTENGVFSSQSNEDFHHQLIEKGYGGYRDIEELTKWAGPLVLSEKIAMPANNLLLVWKR